MTIRIRRYIAAFLDLYFPGSILFLFVSLVEKYFEFNLNLDLFIGVIWSVVLMKDIFTGQSIFKKLLGIKVVYKKTQQPVQPLISIFRNFLALPIFPIEFPIEFIALLFFGIRISDRIFKTEVIVADRMKIVSIYKELREYKTTAYIRDYLLSFILAILGANIYGAFLLILLF